MFAKLKQIYHGMGERAYESTKAKEKYAESLLTLAGYCFTLTVAPIASYALNMPKEKMIGSFFIAVLAMALGLALRHFGLKIIDRIEKTAHRKNRE